MPRTGKCEPTERSQAASDAMLASKFVKAHNISKNDIHRAVGRFRRSVDGVLSVPGCDGSYVVDHVTINSDEEEPDVSREFFDTILHRPFLAPVSSFLCCKLGASGGPVPVFSGPPFSTYFDSQQVTGQPGAFILEFLSVSKAS